MTVRGTGNAGARMPQAVAYSAAAEAAALAHFDSGDGLIDRATGRNLHDKKLMVMIAHRVGIISSSLRIK